ncbi:DNA topoisomerase 2-alpha-like isoform X2 [Lineus longissimus]|uniref:DNA topoisomerase 2-alpha-like isoform X2 n=1 Tax=Lineus longissimus TaxID=88925 RepID=UPI00315C53B4
MSTNGFDGPLKTLFNKAKKKDAEKASSAAEAALAATADIAVGAGDASQAHTSKPASNKRLSVERIYQKKTQLEHILLRPDTYIGSIEALTQPMWVYDDTEDCMALREITYVPGLYKIFDEILVNAADNKVRDPKMTMIKIDIDPEQNMIKIWNNGKGIPVVQHKEEHMYVPTMIFGHLLTSSNYDDEQKKTTGGRNGYGAKLCNIFSRKFVVETSAKDYKKNFKQTWTNNMSKASEPKIGNDKSDDFTAITFYPDLDKFKMTVLDKDIVDLFTKRAYDIAAACHGGVKVFLNGKRLPIKNFRDYVEMYIKNKTDDNNAPLKVVHEVVNTRWEVAVTQSDKGFQQASFVNSIATTKGGRHIDYITDQVVNKLISVVKKKGGKGNFNIKPFQVKSHLWVFVNCLIENPSFDSQTKENMTSLVKAFGSKCQLGEKFVTNVSKSGIVENILSWMKFKAQAQLNKKSGAKTSKLKGVPKLDDANNAGTRFAHDCVLILTEGDSAKALAVAGLGVVGRDNYGVFPLRGKVLNVRDASHKQIMENAEVNNIIKIVGLKYKTKYETPEELKTLRYGKIMIMADQDQDGSHIKGLLVNFFHHNWPALLRSSFLEEFITPIVKVTKNKREVSFYSLPEFEEWKKDTPNWPSWRVKYYKGLGTSTSKEAKEYFSDMLRHRIKFKYSGPEDDASINLAFSRKKTDERKEWLTNWMEERRNRAEMGLPELYLYGKETRAISYNEFINRELILFSNADNERSIPSFVDGLKPGQRKVLFTCLKRNDKREVKVAQLAGSVAEHSSYHHGEASLMQTIVNLAQNFVGSNNINILQPIGQFGTRLHGGKDAASPRYIFTMLSPLAKHIFNPLDTPMLNTLFDDNQSVEPEWYCPILPMVLVNGADGIGTGWSTRVQNYNPRDIVENLKRLMNGEEPKHMLPWYKNFKGDIMEVDDTRCVVNGEIAILDENTVEITELPIRLWTQSYKEQVLEPFLQGTEKVTPCIQDYKEYHTDSTVRFVVKMAREKLDHARAQGLHKYFKIQSPANTSLMVLFDSKGCIKRYSTPIEILKEFFELRMDRYQIRKEYMEGIMSAEALKLENQARFIQEVAEAKIKIEDIRKKSTKEMVQMLLRLGYDSDPIKAWKAAQNKLRLIESQTNQDEEEEEEVEKGPDFNYLLDMTVKTLNKDKREALLKQRDEKNDELHTLRRKSPKDLWHEDLAAFLEELDKVEQKEREDDKAGAKIVAKTSGKGGGGRGAMKQKKLITEMLPSPMAERVVPVIDDAYKKKEPAAKKAKKAAKDDGLKQTNLMEAFDDDDDSNELKPLSERIGSPGKKAAGKVEKANKPKKPRAPKKQKDPDESGSPKKKGRKPTGSPKGKGKKKNPWSDSESDTIEEEFSDDNFGEEERVFIPRERAAGSRRAAASKATFKFGDESDDDLASNPSREAIDDDLASNHSNDDMDVYEVNNDAANDDDGVAADPLDSDSDFGGSVDPPSRNGKNKYVIDSESDTTDMDEEAPKPKKQATFDDIFGKPNEPKKTSAAPKPKMTVTFSDDDDDDDFGDLVMETEETNSQTSTATADSIFSKPASKPASKPVKEPKKRAPKKPKADGEPKPKKPRAPKKKKISDDDTDDEMMPKKKTKKAPAKKGKKASFDSDFDDDDFAASTTLTHNPSADRAGRQRKQVKYTFDDDDEDSDSWT